MMLTYRCTEERFAYLSGVLADLCGDKKPCLCARRSLPGTPDSGKPAAASLKGRAERAARAERAVCWTRFRSQWVRIKWAGPAGRSAQRALAQKPGAPRRQRRQRRRVLIGSFRRASRKQRRGARRKAEATLFCFHCVFDALVCRQSAHTPPPRPAPCCRSSASTRNGRAAALPLEQDTVLAPRLGAGQGGKALRPG